jgi:hypothetical protein
VSAVRPAVRPGGLGQLRESTVRLFSPEKTIADCFKYRNEIGLDVAIESLRAYKEKKPTQRMPPYKMPYPPTGLFSRRVFLFIWPNWPH